MLTGGDGPEVFESLEKLEDAIACAQADIARLDQYPVCFIQAQTALGRCQAKLGRLQEAKGAFDTGRQRRA